MLKNLAVIGVAAAVGIIGGDMLADKVLMGDDKKIRSFAEKSENMQKGIRYASQGIGVALAYSVAKSFIR